MKNIANFLRYYISIILLSVVAVYRLMNLCGGVEQIFSCTGEMTKLGSENISYVKDLRYLVTNNVYRFLPSPHADLLLGMVLGIDNLKKSPRFNDILKLSGTVHVVVVSGYNISLVFELMFKLIGSKYRLKNLLIAQSAVCVYAVISGFQVPVIRSLIMGSIVAWGKFYGRSLDVVRVLLFSGLFILVVWPDQLFSLSFQLSFLATLSLVCFSDFFDSWKVATTNDVVSSLFGDLKSTLAAQILVTPLISFAFGRISLVSPLANMCILWVVPLCTVLGVIYIPVSFIPIIADVFSKIIFIPLDFFVTVVSLFARIPYASMNFTLNSYMLVGFYLVVTIFLLFSKSFRYSSASRGDKKICL